MKNMSIKKELTGNIEELCQKITEAIKPIGFGILTRIDFDQKIKEKLNQTIPRTVILGACNPKLAYEAYSQSTDVTLLMPCNIVVRETGPNKITIEAIRPSKMLEFLQNISKVETLLQAEKDLERIILSL